MGAPVNLGNLLTTGSRPRTTVVVHGANGCPLTCGFPCRRLSQTSALTNRHNETQAKMHLDGQSKYAATLYALGLTLLTSQASLSIALSLTNMGGPEWSYPLSLLHVITSRALENLLWKAEHRAARGGGVASALIKYHAPPSGYGNIFGAVCRMLPRLTRSR